MKISRFHITLIVLIIFYTVGIAGIGFGLDAEMVNLSWMNLSLTGGLVLLNVAVKNRPFWIFSGAVFFSGLLVEIIGVQTGFPFGSYWYGESLGLKLWGAPLVIGLNWWLLTYCSCNLVQSSIPGNNLIKSALAAAAMLGLDALIEPLCSTLDFWHWQDSNIPLENYVSWFIIAFVFNYFYFNFFKDQKPNPLASIAFLVQVLFFAILNWKL